MSRAEIYIKQKDLDEAAKCVQRMIAIDAKSPETSPGGAHVRKPIARTQISSTMPLPGSATCWRSTTRCPKSITPGDLLTFRKGDLNHAKDDFEQLVRIFPQFPEAQERLRAIREKLANPHP